MYPLIILTLILPSITPNNIPLFKDYVVDPSIIEFANWYFEYSHSITLISQHRENSFVKMNFTLKIFRNYSHIPHDVDVSQNYILHEGNPEKLKMILNSFKNYPYKSTMKVLIIHTNTITSYLELFKQTYELKLNNVLLLYAGRKTVRIYHYNYFKQTLKYFKINDYNGVWTALNDADYNGYKLKATIFENVPTAIKVNGVLTGIDPMVFKAVAEKLNFTLVYHEPYDGNRYGSRQLNGKTTGAIAELYNGESEISCNQIFLKNYDAPELKFTSTIFSDKLCVVVPSAGLKPMWSIVFSVFSTSVWILIVVTLSVSVVLLVYCRKFNALIAGNMGKNLHQCDERYTTAFIDILQITYNIASQKIYSSNVVERVFIGVLLIFIITINPTFTAGLFSVMRHPRYYKDIDTLEDLDKSNYKISTSSHTLLDTFKNSANEYSQSLDSKLVLLPETAPYESAYLSRQSQVRYSRILEFARHGTVETHKVQQCPKVYLLSYLTHRDALFFGHLNGVLDALSAAGLHEKWYKDAIINATSMYFIKQWKNFDVLENSVVGLEVLTLWELQICFYILSIGCFISTVVFCLEFFHVI